MYFYGTLPFNPFYTYTSLFHLIGGGGRLESQVLFLVGIVNSCCHYLEDLQSLSTPTVPSVLECYQGPSPLNLSNLLCYLRRHPDPRFASFIFHGLHDGFRIGFAPELVSLASASHNHPASANNPSFIADHIREELRLGRLAGPIPQSLAGHVHVSPIGLVPSHIPPGGA